MPPVDAAALLRVTREHRDETEACRWLLERVLEEVVALLREACLGAPATALGASLHLHDGAAFRLSLGQERREGAFSADHHASANVWAGLKEHAEALTLDVRPRPLGADRAPRRPPPADRHDPPLDPEQGHPPPRPAPARAGSGALGHDHRGDRLPLGHRA